MAQVFKVNSDRSYAFNIDIEKDFFNKSFGQQLDTLKKVKEFCGNAKSSYVGAKRRPVMACVKEWIKLNKPTKFYCSWKTETEFYKDDSVQIFYEE